MYQVPLRAAPLPNDVDCCLDLRRSPLVLDFPALTFRDLPDDPEAVETDTACTAYYEGLACLIRPFPPDHPDHALSTAAAAYFQERCGAVHRVGGLEPLLRGAVAPRSTAGFFDDMSPSTTLFRWWKHGEHGGA